MLIKSHIPSGRVISVLFPLLGGCLLGRTADAVARLRFASLDLRKASLQFFESQLVAMAKATGRISPSLLQRIPEKRSKDAHKRFKLGMGAWTESDNSGEEEDKENAVPRRTKKLKLDKKKPSAERWHFISEEREEVLGKKYVPKNTATSTKWALGNFSSWRDSRNKRFSTDASKVVPDHLLESTEDPATICKWLTLYIAETRKKDGTKYPPKTIYSLLSGLLRHTRAHNPQCPNFLDPDDLRFATLHNAVDNIFRELRQSGIGSETKSAEVFTREDENQLWEAGALATTSPKALLRAVFFLNGKNFCLRGGEEHRQLKLSQVKRHPHPDRYVYTEHASKNRSGGMAQMRVKNKVVPVYSVPEAGNRCHVKILDMYLSKLPRDALLKDNFYLQPLASVPENPQKPWFSSVPVGRNTLGKMVKDICAQGKIVGNKTNHSLRATGASSMFQAGVPEKIIQQFTGHRSLAGLREYYR